VPDAEAIARALADIRGIPPVDTPQETAQALAEPTCCAGDYAGHQRHRWHKEQPCEASMAAARDYQRAYRATHREQFRDYNRRYAARLKGDAPDAARRGAGRVQEQLGEAPR
jgi:hypothetical protein